MEIEGELTETLDYTMRYTYNDETVTIDGEDVVQSQLLKTEKIMADSTIYLVIVQDDCISQIQTYPEVQPIQQPPTTEERLQAVEDALLMII